MGGPRSSPSLCLPGSEALAFVVTSFLPRKETQPTAPLAKPSPSQPELLGQPSPSRTHPRPVTPFGSLPNSPPRSIRLLRRPWKAVRWPSDWDYFHLSLCLCSLCRPRYSRSQPMCRQKAVPSDKDLPFKVKGTAVLPGNFALCSAALR